VSLSGLTARSRLRGQNVTYSRSSAAVTAARAMRLGRTRTGLALVALIVAVAVFGPLVAPHSATALVGAPFENSAPGLPFGTDYLGRDVLSRFLDGGQTLLILSVLATLLGVGTGAVIGVTAAYSRGVVDDVLMRCSDVVLAFPQIMLILMLVTMAGSHSWLLVLTVAAGHAPQTARVIRGAALTVIDREFVQHSAAVGQPTWRLLAFDVLPNVSSPLMVELGLRMTYSIALIAGASFLGFGIQPPAADWGLMINENQVGLATAPWGVALPVIAIALLTVGTNLVTDGIAQAAVGIGE